MIVHIAPAKKYMMMSNKSPVPLIQSRNWSNSQMQPQKIAMNTQITIPFNDGMKMAKRPQHSEKHQRKSGK